MDSLADTVDVDADGRGTRVLLRFANRVQAPAPASASGGS